MAVKKPTKNKRKAGRPKKPLLTKKTDEVLILALKCGATFVFCAEKLGVTKEAIFMRMAKYPALKEQVYRARAEGLTVRGMEIEDVIYSAILQVAEDPRYTTLAIYASKVLLKWSDLPDNLTTGEDMGEVIKALVSNKKDKQAWLTNQDAKRKSPAREYLTTSKLK